jgi:hypothetical protein
MSDDTHDDTNDLSHPFYYEDTLSQRAVAFYHVAKLTDSDKNETVKELCRTILRKLNASIADIHRMARKFGPVLRF